MKRAIILIVFAMLLVSSVSAEIIINQQPKSLYNMGDVIKIPTKITTSTGINDFFSMILICNGIETEVHKQYISLEAGEEQQITTAIPLIKSFIGRTTGTCKLKDTLGSDTQITNEFEISDKINVELRNQVTEIAPEKNLIIEGEAIKQNGEYLDGFIDITIQTDGLEPITLSDSVNNGYFYMNYSFPKETKSGQYLINVQAYDKNEGNISNSGFFDYNVLVSQVPTSLEIAFDTEDVSPGDNAKIKAVLHDQTGEKIDSISVITIKDEKDNILEQTEIRTDEFLEYPVAYNYPSSEWKVLAVSNKLSAEASFKIIEKESVKIEILNKTVVLTNDGNVPYNDTVLIKIGNNSVNLKAYLEVDGVQKYYLTAPNGEYDVSILSNGESKATGRVILTGSAVSVREAGARLFTGAPLVWVFIIGVLGLMAFIVFKKGYNKAFVGYITKVKENRKTKVLEKENLINPHNRAELILSIKGESQTASLVCLKLKNYREILTNEASKQALQETADFSAKHKAMVYENNDNIFYILAPSVTKTFKNEKTSIELAEGIKEILERYNKLARQKIDFGISVNLGSIVAKTEKGLLTFMTLENLMGTSKKIALNSKNEISLSEKVMDKLRADVKAEKSEVDGIPVYKLTEIKKKSEKNEKFIHNFIRKLEKENKDKQEKK